MTALLEAREAVVGYDAPVAGPLSFTLHAGEVLGVQGPNGAGKSTLLRTLTGEARLLAGTLARAPGLRLAYQPQQPVRLAEMPLTGAELIRAAGAGRWAPPPALRPWLGRRVDALSGGQYQVLSIWCALAGDATVVLLDEPTNNLDQRTVATLAELLPLHAEQRGVMIVSHDARFLASVCNRLLELP